MYPSVTLRKKLCKSIKKGIQFQAHPPCFIPNTDGKSNLLLSDRFKILNLQGPQHNIAARQRNMKLASAKTQPSVFYKHEGQYAFGLTLGGCHTQQFVLSQMF